MTRKDDLLSALAAEAEKAAARLRQTPSGRAALDREARHLGVESLAALLGVEPTTETASEPISAPTTATPSTDVPAPSDGSQIASPASEITEASIARDWPAAPATPEELDFLAALNATPREPGTDPGMAPYREQIDPAKTRAEAAVPALEDLG